VSPGSQQEQEEEVPRRPAGELVLVIGNLTIDDVVLPDGVTHMATLGGNSVHAATAVVTGGAKAALAARRGEDFPPGALAVLAAEGIDLAGLVDIPGPTVRNWVIYEADGRRHWLYRTPPQRSAEAAPEPADLDPAMLRRAAVVHVAAMLGNAERIVAHVRRQAPGALVTVDTHESWDSPVAGRVLALARTADLFVPSLAELAQLTGAGEPAGGLRALAAAGLGQAVVKAAAAGAYVLEGGRITRVPAARTVVADSTGAGDAFCGGLAAGLARGLSLVESAGLGAPVAAGAITESGSLRLLRPNLDRAGIAWTARRLAAAAAEVNPPAADPPADGTEPGGPVNKTGAIASRDDSVAGGTSGAFGVSIDHGADGTADGSGPGEARDSTGAATARDDSGQVPRQTAPAQPPRQTAPGRAPRQTAPGRAPRQTAPGRAPRKTAPGRGIGMTSGSCAGR
jgi:sugar/nucleoside kinase (ribokinase family)